MCAVHLCSTHTLFTGVRRRFYCSAEKKYFLFAPVKFPAHWIFAPRKDVCRSVGATYICGCSDDRQESANKILYVSRKHCLWLMQALFLHVSKAVFVACKNYFYRLQKPFLQSWFKIRWNTGNYRRKGNKIKNRDKSLHFKFCISVRYQTYQIVTAGLRILIGRPRAGWDVPVW